MLPESTTTQENRIYKASTGRRPLSSAFVETACPLILCARPDILCGGDGVLIWKLARLGRSLHHRIEVVITLTQRGVGFKSLQ